MKKYAILGAARSGLSLARFLVNKNEEVTLFDDNNSNYLKLSDFQENQFDYIIKSPGISNQHPAIVNCKKFLYSDIEIISQYMNNTNFLAVTGTNGKTTTASLLAHILGAKLGGNVGVALADVVDNGDVVVEVSSFQAEGLKTFKPHIACLLNLTPDHLDRYSNVDEYYLAKFNLFKNMDENDFLIINADDKNILKLINKINLRCQIKEISFNQRKNIYIDDKIVYCDNVKLFNIDKLNLIGSHNLFNAMVAATMAYLNGLNPLCIEESVSQFQAIKHRMQLFHQFNGVKFINDSKATNPEASEVAIKSFSHNVHWILGGYDKHTGFDILKQYESIATQIYVFGETSDQLSKTFKNALVFKTLDEVVSALKTKIQAGDIVLFSPACASFDQFKDFEQRGDYFMKIIKDLF